MSNSCLKVTLEKKRYSQNFNFPILKNLSPGQFLGSSNSKLRGLRAKLCVVFLSLWIWKELWQFKERMHFVGQKLSFNKNETGSKKRKFHTILERQTLCFSSYKNWKLKVKLWWVGALKKRGLSGIVYFVWNTFCF